MKVLKGLTIMINKNGFALFGLLMVISVIRAIITLLRENFISEAPYFSMLSTCNLKTKKQNLSIMA
jgi:hypothetical protein